MTQREYEVVSPGNGSTFLARRDPAMAEAREESKRIEGMVRVEKLHRTVVALFDGGKRIR